MNFDKTNSSSAKVALMAIYVIVCSLVVVTASYIFNVVISGISLSSNFYFIELFSEKTTNSASLKFYFISLIIIVGMIFVIHADKNP